MLIRAVSNNCAGAGEMTIELRRAEVTTDSEPLPVTGVEHTGVIPTDMKGAALWYAAHGFPVFPLKPGEKRPLTAHGFKDATTDLATVSGWWTSCPDANIGISTGAASGIMVLDLDPRNGAPAGRLEVVQQLGPIPETAEVSTGGEGRHIYFRHSGKKLRKNLAPGVELKTDGGYIVVPPSVHPSGERYQWDGIRGELALLCLADAPDWLLALADSEDQGRPVRLNTREKWSRGCRNDRLMSLAGSMRRRDMAQSAILEALLEENQIKCDPPLSIHEVEQIVKSAMRYEPAEQARTTTYSCPGNTINWPHAMGPQAYIGAAGDLVRSIEPHSEADPAALLLQFLVCFGNVIGRTAYFMAEADKHFGNLFVVLVGMSAKGRKGTSLGQIRRVFSHIDPDWVNKSESSGLSTGEGLIHCVRDAVRESIPIRERGQIVRYEEQVTDAGATDKRLLVVEPEFARVLQVSERDTNTVSAIIRQAWDSGNLQILTKKQAARSSDAHISIIGHITKDELKRLLTDTAAGNGFANRFLWVCTQRSKLLPEGGSFESVDFSGLTQRVREGVNFAAGVGRLCRDEEAKEAWCSAYPALSEANLGSLAL
jgi:Bifunctional DNA primase/polymerase, N-terminal/Primase C terminal 1 (PriCT-1)